LLDTSFPLLTASPAIALISLLCLFVTTINTQCLVHSHASAMAMLNQASLNQAVECRIK
jgi:hypothetical protein